MLLHTPLNVLLQVLIQAKVAKLLPEWLRFIKGVVDSEDIPLNLSREILQDGSLIAKINSILTGRIIKFLQRQRAKDEGAYEKFFVEYGNFLREGVCTDAANQVRPDTPLKVTDLTPVTDRDSQAYAV